MIKFIKSNWKLCWWTNQANIFILILFSFWPWIKIIIRKIQRINNNDSLHILNTNENETVSVCSYFFSFILFFRLDQPYKNIQKKKKRKTEEHTKEFLIDIIKHVFLVFCFFTAIIALAIFSETKTHFLCRRRLELNIHFLFSIWGCRTSGRAL